MIARPRPPRQADKKLGIWGDPRETQTHNPTQMGYVMQIKIDMLMYGAQRGDPNVTVTCRACT